MCMHVSAGELALAWLATLGVTGAGAAVIGALVHHRAERRGRSRWWEVPDGTVDAGPQDGPFRAAGPVPRYLSRAPVRLRRASYASIVLGLCALPLVPLAIMLLPVAGLGALLAPFIHAGWRLFAAGRALLLRDFSAVSQALGATRYLSALSWISLTLLLLPLIVSGGSPLVLAIAAPAVIGLLVAHALRGAVWVNRGLLDYEGG
jgi:hypothetical protein